MLAVGAPHTTPASKPSQLLVGMTLPQSQLLRASGLSLTTYKPRHHTPALMEGWPANRIMVGTPTCRQHAQIPKLSLMVITCGDGLSWVNKQRSKQASLVTEAITTLAAHTVKFVYSDHLWAAKKFGLSREVVSLQTNQLTIGNSSTQCV